MRRSRRISYLTQSYETNSGREEGDICCGGHPHIPRQGLRPCNPFPGFRRSDILACGRPSLVRYYPHTEQVSLDLNTYPGARANSRSPGDGCGNRSPSHWRQAPTYDRCPNYRLPTSQLDPSGHGTSSQGTSGWLQRALNVSAAPNNLDSRTIIGVRLRCGSIARAENRRPSSLT